MLRKLAFVLLMIGILSGCAASAETPMSAEGMSEEERLKNDAAVLLEELSSLGAEQIEINYARDAIKVYISKESTAQYVSEVAGDIVNKIESVLKERRSDLTLEKQSYAVYVYGSDNRLIYT
ncbi:hypothetical protein V7149_00085 [Bacillus sp. JJ1503]|uniref:hypothetical protein n=1 Tax=Bacillus sp. JJ1503 TaxID=3122956 RepID=UPI002FFE3AA6